jgi:RNA polymerase sigma-32 factor
MEPRPPGAALTRRQRLREPLSCGLDIAARGGYVPGPDIRRQRRAGKGPAMTGYANLPAPSPEQGLNRYMQEIRRFPMLAPEEEYMLAKRWADHHDTEAAHRLVTSHLRLAAKIAMGYRGYGLPTAEVISEANVGLMQAVKRFDPEKGFRLATYAMWWIRASIQEYILRSWSLVKLGTTSAQKKLFFNLRKAKARIGALEEGDLRPENVARIAHDLNVTEDEVIAMNRRLAGGDASLNAQIGGADGEGTTEWVDWIEDEGADQAADYAERDELETRRGLLEQAMDVLNDRERDILTRRRLEDEPVTLETLSGEYDVSRERIRQIEVRAFEKLQKRMRELARARGVLPAA